MACREVDVAYPLIQEFLRILRQRTPDALDARFVAAAASGIRDIQTIADGLQRDQEALWQA